MPDKESGESEKSADVQALERHVDALMNVKTPADEPSPVSHTEGPDSEKATGTTALDQKTAPELPAKLLNNVDSDKAHDPKPPAQSTAATTPAEKDEDIPPPAQQPKTDAASPTNEPDDVFNDSATNKAVDDIIAQEGDTQLAVDDALAARRNAAVAVDDSPVIPTAWIWIIVIVLLLAIAYSGYRYLGIQ